MNEILKVMSSKLKSYILLACFALILLLAFNSTQKGAVTETQKRYSELENLLKNEIDQSIIEQRDLKGYKIILTHRAVGNTVTWNFPKQELLISKLYLPLDGQRLLRLVRLLNEAEIFTVNLSQSGPYELKLISPNGTYTSSFRPTDLEFNSALRNFVQLIKLYGTPK